MFWNVLEHFGTLLDILEVLGGVLSHFVMIWDFFDILWDVLGQIVAFWDVFGCFCLFHLKPISFNNSFHLNYLYC